MGVRAMLEPHSSTKTNWRASSWLTSARQALRCSSLRSVAPSVFFCASSRHGEWRDSSWYDRPTCHDSLPRVDSELAASYRGGLAVGQPARLLTPHISWTDVLEWVWERGLRFLV